MIKDSESRLHNRIRCVVFFLIVGFYLRDSLELYLTTRLLKNKTTVLARENLKYPKGSFM